MNRVWDSGKQNVLDVLEKALTRSVLEKFKPDLKKIRYAYLAYTKEDFENKIFAFIPKTKANKKSLAKLKDQVKIVIDKKLIERDMLYYIKPNGPRILSRMKKEILFDIKNHFGFYNKSDLKEYIHLNSPYELPKDIVEEIDSLYKSNVKTKEEIVFDM